MKTKINSAELKQGRQRKNKGSRDKAGNYRLARLISLVRKNWKTIESEWKRLFFSFLSSSFFLKISLKSVSDSEYLTQYMPGLHKTWSLDQSKSGKLKKTRALRVHMKKRPQWKT